MRDILVLFYELFKDLTNKKKVTVFYVLLNNFIHFFKKWNLWVFWMKNFVTFKILLELTSNLKVKILEKRFNYSGPIDHF